MASSVQLCSVLSDDHDIRVDRWFKRHYPSVKHGALEKFLRTGQVRVDGKRTTSNARLTKGQVVRIPPLEEPEDLEAEAIAAQAGDPSPQALKALQKDLDYLKSLILYEDADLMVINKPSGLASQGGSGMTRHVDGLLFAMAKGKSRPVLVHRLDRDTSGCLVIAKKTSIAASLGKVFQTRTVQKYYWALVQGYPPAGSTGKITQHVAKRMMGGREGEKMVPVDAKDPDGQTATTHYRVLEHTARLFSWMVMQPITGRTHQLRVHAQCLGIPMVGDYKYGAEKTDAGLANQLHLHARRIQFPHPKTGQMMDITAPLPSHMKKSWDALGFTIEPYHDRVEEQFSPRKDPPKTVK